LAANLKTLELITVSSLPRAAGLPVADADACESDELAHPDSRVERILRRLCRNEILADAYLRGLARLANERERLERELAAIEAGP
jgi:hypothetical protein